MGELKQRSYPKSGAIRSDEAIKRRAEKRGVTFEVQLAADLKTRAEQRDKRAASGKIVEEKLTKSEVKAAKRKKKEKESTKIDSDAEDPSPVKKKAKKDKHTEPDEPPVVPVKTISKIMSQLEEFISANEFDDRCLRSLRKLTEEEAEWVMSQGGYQLQVEADPAKGTPSLLVTARCKLARKTLNPDGDASAKALKSAGLPALEWPSQAGPDRIEYNRLLRERFASNPETLTDVEVERAKILSSRDERKSVKKSAAAKLWSSWETDTTSLAASTSVEPSSSGRGAGRGSGRGGAGRGRGS